MSSIIDPNRARDILSVPLQALPDLWAQAQTGADQLQMQLSRGQWSRQLTGNAAGLQQQVVVAADRGLGWAPWQGDAVSAIASLPTPQLISGILFDAIFSGELKEMTYKALRELAEIAIGEILTPFLNLLTSIPVIGWILDILVSLVEAIVGLVKLAKASEDAKQAEGTVQAVVPSIDFDESLTKAVLEIAKTGDWTALFVPVADPVGQMIHERGFSCALIEPGGAFANWRRVLPLGDDAWGVPSGRGIGATSGVTSNSGLGLVPGTPAIHGGFQWGGSQVVDMGDWLPMSTSAALQCWSLVWGDGPALWAVNPDTVETAWARYVSMFLEDLASGKTCPKNSAAQRSSLRNAFIRRMGLDPMLPGGVKKRSDASVIEQCAPVVAARALRARQAAYKGRTSIAYVNEFEAPEGLREGIRAAQAELRESYDVCAVDRFAVPDGLYRSQVETAQEKYGDQCLHGQGLTAALAGPITWNPSAPDVPDPSPAMPRASTTTTSGGPPVHGSGPTPSRVPPSTSATRVVDDGGGGGALAVAALALAGAAAFVLRKKR